MKRDDIANAIKSNRLAAVLGAAAALSRLEEINLALEGDSDTSREHND